MNCPKCGAENIMGSSFCIKCGNNLKETTQNQNSINTMLNNEQKNQEQNIQSTQIEQQPQSFQQSTQGVQSVDNQQNTVYSQQISNNTQNVNSNISSTSTTSTNTKISFMGYIFIVIAIILKPFTAFKEELNKFSSFKNSAFVALILSILATIINLLTTMFNVVRVKGYDWSAGGQKTTWVWENLKDLDYVKIIGKNFLIYLGIIIAIACVYYIASLIVKKQTNFSRMLGISSVAVAPLLICTLILSPLLSMIYAPLGMGITIVGAVYTILLIYEGMNGEVLVDGNAKYYFNLVCLSILAVATYYLYLKLFMSSVSSGLDDLLDMFN